MNALGEGEAWVRGANPGADVRATRGTLRALGMTIVRQSDGYRVRGRDGRLKPASDALDCGNSGTTMRLLAGLCAAQGFTSTLDGDESLRRRPMLRISRPLRAMGAQVDGPDAGRTPPLIITGGSLAGGLHTLEIASAQVKSCLLLAAAAARCEVEIREPGLSRDHTERMLLAMGAQLERTGGSLTLQAHQGLRCLSIDVPGDPSAAALVAATALAIPGSRVEFQKMLLNATRTAYFAVLEHMGAHLERGVERESGGEFSAELALAAGEGLRAVCIEPAEIPALIDEIPALCVVAAFAEGVSRFRGIGELRVKESDRVEAILHMLRAFAVDCGVVGEELWVRGGVPVAPASFRPARDHRIVMASAALGLGALARAGRGELLLAECDEVAVSYPQFFTTLESLAASS